MRRSSNFYFNVFGIALAVVVGVVAIATQGSSTPGPMAFEQGELLQVEENLEFTVHTTDPLNLTTLDPQPDFNDPKARYLCLSMEQVTDDDASRTDEKVCLGGSRDEVGLISGEGKEESKPRGTLRGHISQLELGSTTMRLPLEELSLPAGAYRYKFISSDGTCGSKPDRKCINEFDGNGGDDFDLKTPELVGCSVTEPREARFGSDEKRVVALTFDDGPGVSTGKILRILERKRVAATFFLVGDFVAENPVVARKIVEQGSEVANHSMHHDARPPLEDLEQTNDLIETSTGVRPCSFRPPYGQVDANLSANAASAGMNTVLWNVDTEDWMDSSTVDSVIGGTFDNTTPGSIILMHDGGVNRRDRTITALPRIIDGLRNRGFTFVTVAELLGGEVTYELPADS